MNGVPEKIGKYKIQEVVARGGMGVVYKAMHPNLKHQVVIKKLTIRGNKPVLERFKREARVLLELQHANIVRMFDYFTEGSFHYIVLELVDGMSLDKLIRKAQKLSWPTALLLVRDSCKALKFAHVKGIIHRDIKPGNILISTKGEIKLADFGIASMEKESESEEDITQIGVTLGTPAYMPPEQFGDSKNVTARADIYALGIMLYEMITGKKPYNANMSPETLILIKKGQYTAPHKIEKTIPKSISRIIKKMMHPQPNKRYKNIDAVLKAVNKQLNKFEIKPIRVSMVKLMLMKSYTEQAFIPKHKSLHKLFLIVVSSLVVVVGSIFAWQQGYIHATILRRLYTPITVTLETSKTSALSSGVPMSAQFYFNDNADIPMVKNSLREFKMQHETNDSEVYRAKPVYVTRGMYRVKVVVGSDVFWKSLRVDENEQNIIFDIHTAEARTLRIKTLAFDMETGENLSSKTNFLVFFNNSWVNINDLTRGELKTGSVLKIRAESEGYITENFSLLIEWYQDELTIEALMELN